MAETICRALKRVKAICETRSPGRHTSAYLSAVAVPRVVHEHLTPGVRGARIVPVRQQRADWGELRTLVRALLSTNTPEECRQASTMPWWVRR